MMEYNELIKNINILLADDDEDYMMMTYAFLTQFGYKVDRAKNGREALSMLKQDKYQIALLDYYMPELTGEDVVKEIRKENKELIIILQTGFSGQKPPIETMKKLGIQNYYDKTEGIDRLHLELISAIKMYKQQNEIELSKFKTTAIGDLIYGVAQEIKGSLLGISAGMEVTNMFLNQVTSEADKEKLLSINKYYENNKVSLERVDKVLSSIINQSTENTQYVLLDTDVVELLELILKSKAKLNSVNVNIKAALKTTGYIKGSINDSIFIVAKIVDTLIKLHEKNTNIDVVLTDDQEYRYFKIKSDKISKISHSEKYLLKRVIEAMQDTSMEETENMLTISIKK